MDSSTFDPQCRDRSRYKFRIEDRVRFSDLDALGHVSSVRVNEYFATARTTLFKQAVPGWPSSDPVPILKLNVVLHEAEIGYPQDLQIGLCVEKFGNTSVTLLMGLFAGDKCLVLCRNIFVFVSAGTHAPIVPDDKIRHDFLSLAP